MLTKKVIYLATIIISSCLFESKAQEKPNNCDIRKYNYYTNLAELHILDSTFQQALHYYDSAFYYAKSPFYRDRYNYLVCNALVGDYAKCRTAVIYLLEKGMNDKLVFENPALSSFLASSFGEDIHKLDLGPTYDTSLRLKYDSLIIEDQTFRKLNRHHYRDFYSDLIDKIDSSNIVCMLDLINKRGWPTIDNIGIPQSIDFKYEAIIIHQGDPKYQLYNFSKDIMFAYENCCIEGDRAFKLVTLSNNHKISMANLVTIVYDSLNLFTNKDLNAFSHKTGFFKLDDEEMAIINEERKLFGLESITDFRRKVLYGLKDKRFMLEFTAGKEFYAFNTLSDYVYACKNLVSIID